MFYIKTLYIRVVSLTIFLLMAAFQNVIALDQSISTTMNVTVTPVFSIGFYSDANILYSITVPFSDVDPTKSMVYPNGRSENDGKSDTGVVCVSNIGDAWYLKIQGIYSEGIPDAAVKYYYDQPYNRNTGKTADGSLAFNVGWRPIPKEATTIYTAGNTDSVNTPFGTLSTFSFAVDPRGLDADKTYTVSVTYTMTTAP
ncbi:MAG: hypothetical protein JW994_06850 [Candidatus Omnitrophica bacterium]|nr:hypothetical protein [Candidatus Omnitrophota bacterium]